MDPNARPAIALPDGRDAVEVFGETTVDGIWPHLLVPRPSDSAASLASTLHSLEAESMLEPAPDSSTFEALAAALWNTRLGQQTSWPADGWPLDRIAARLRANGIGAAWSLQVGSDEAAVDALRPLQREGMRGAVFLTESQAVELALEPGPANIATEGFVEPVRRGVFGRRTIDVDEYRAVCEGIAIEVVAAARAAGVTAHWDGDWERAVVLENVQFVARLP
ncbi:MAG: DUF6891 domain-containing protein [Pseudoclavibacter sp.]